MGHYEDSYASDDAQSAKKAEEQRQKLIKKIKADIKARGVAIVLADIVIEAGIAHKYGVTGL